MNRIFKKLLLSFTILAISASLSFADGENWVNISDTQNIDPNYTTEEIKSDKKELQYLFDEIQEINIRLSNNAISKEEYIELTNKKQKEFNILFSKLEKYGLIKKDDKNSSNQLIKSKSDLDAQMLDLISKLNYLKYQIQSLDDKLKRNEITKEEYQDLYNKYYAEYDNNKSSLDLISVEEKIIPIEKGEVLADGAIFGISIEPTEKDSTFSLSNFNFEEYSKEFRELQELYKNKQINDVEFEKRISEIKVNLSSSSNDNSDNVKIIVVGKSEMTPVSLDNLYTEEYLKKSISILEDLLNSGKITKSQYDKKLEFYNEMSKKYNDKK